MELPCFLANVQKLMKKRILAVCMALFAITTLYADSYSNFYVNRIGYRFLNYYVYKGDSLVEPVAVSQYFGYSTSVNIPDSVTFDGKVYPIVEIWDAFTDCSSLTSITIPNSVWRITNSAFKGCSSLTSITIPSSVTKIGHSIVSGCGKLDTVIWNVKNCTIESGSENYPFYDEKGESSISSFIFGNGVENIPDYLCYGLNKLTSVTIPNSVQSVGVCAFANCKYLEEVSFGTGIEEIGGSAFAGDERIYSVTCYADVTPTIYETTFSGVSSNAELHVLANLVKKYKVNEYWSKFTIVPISVDNTTNGTLTVRPSDTDATFTWPADSNADSYTLTIQKGDVVFCRLIFNGEGQLTSIAFAPARGEAKHTPAASLSAEGYKFTVTGLDEASHYTYQIVVKDWENQVLNTYNGEFNTNGYTAIDGTMVQESGIGVRKVLRDGQVYILRGGKTYTLTGTEVF